jgi:hypothetical protein
MRPSFSYPLTRVAARTPVTELLEPSPNWMGFLFLAFQYGSTPRAHVRTACARRGASEVGVEERWPWWAVVKRR